MVRRVKKKAGENLSPENIQKVYALMNPDSGNPISKKEACQLLNIAYNTTRLNRVIEEWLDQRDYIKKRKAQNRGKAATKQEIAEVVKSYLDGDPISDIAKSLYRSSAFVKSIIENTGVPTKPSTAEEREKPSILPEECMSESFEVGELAWSAKHHSLVEIREEISVNHQAEKAGFQDVNYEKKYSSKCYAIWVFEDIDDEKDFWVRGITSGGYNAYALACELGSLKHLKELGVSLG